jgi:hypothetical protein
MPLAVTAELCQDLGICQPPRQSLEQIGLLCVEDFLIKFQSSNGSAAPTKLTGPIQTGFPAFVTKSSIQLLPAWLNMLSCPSAVPT